jgi:hypothetical protein
VISAANALRVNVTRDEGEQQRQHQHDAMERSAIKDSFCVKTLRRSLTS